VIGDLTVQLPARVIAEILGIDPSRHAERPRQVVSWPWAWT